ncbi:ATP synthase subunit s, mitochondrial-like [Oppia nitens]|uniref:ATP synthase subunit s, mitochondrial-like n=1 Tax=Oppia nitens TaxID=1686743 RepID=UPI0023DCAD75|nr:ATP synthase subunit s, mitochondrial-like [Oppia nitens]
MSVLFKRLTHQLVKRSTNERHIWGWLMNVFNRPDPQRIEAVGADRAAAEWLIKNGAAVKWTNGNNWVKDYNILATEDMQRKIKEIDATDSAISHIGFSHLNGLQELDKFIIANNGYIEDSAIEMLGICKQGLRHLEIISCIGVTDKGILSLTQLENLKYLKLFDLPSVKDRDVCLNYLKSRLKCEINWKEAKPKKLI